MMWYSGIFSKGNNRWKARTTCSEFELKYLNLAGYFYFCDSYYDVWKNLFVHFFIHHLSYSKLFDFLWCFYDSLFGDWALFHDKSHTISLDFTSQRLCQKIRISLNRFVVRKNLFPLPTLINNFKLCFIKKCTRPRITQNNSFSFHFFILRSISFCIFTSTENGSLFTFLLK